MHEHSRAFTLVECLIVIVIVTLLMALFFPVLRSSREKAKQTGCTSQLRQLGMALNLYRSDFNDLPRTSDIGILKETGYVTNAKLFICPVDVFGGLWTKDLACRRYRIGSNQSYYTPLAPDMIMWTHLLLPADANPGVLACRSHGEKTPNFTTDPKQLCRQMYALYDKKVLRLRLDGSVRLVNFSIAPQTGKPGVIRHFSFLRLFTDTPLSRKKGK
jgi:prepilin-type N-terminal cleavage/methylation domain-containing protein